MHSKTAPSAATAISPGAPSRRGSIGVLTGRRNRRMHGGGHWGGSRRVERRLAVSLRVGQSWSDCGSDEGGPATASDGRLRGRGERRRATGDCGPGRAKDRRVGRGGGRATSDGATGERRAIAGRGGRKIGGSEGATSDERWRDGRATRCGRGGTRPQALSSSRPIARRMKRAASADFPPSFWPSSCSRASDRSTASRPAPGS